MKKHLDAQRLVHDIEWMPRVEVIIYATLGIKRCSYFHYDNEELNMLCIENNFNFKKFLEIIRQLGLVIRDGHIMIASWPKQGNFDRKYKLMDSCRSDNAHGLFLDIPKCCAEAYAKHGNIRDRVILQKYPFRGASTPEQLVATHIPNEGELWWNDFSKHLRDRDVLDCSKETALKVKQLIIQKKLPEEVVLLSSMYVPCRVNCKKFIRMAQKMNKSLRCCLSFKRYQEIIEGYVNKGLYL